MHRWIIVGLAICSGCSEYGINEKVEPPIPGDDPEDVDPNDGTDTDLEEEETVELADAPVYANTSTTLYEIEPSTGGAIWIGEFWEGSNSVDKFVDIAIDNDGRMYGGTFDALYRIDPKTAEVTFVCPADQDMTGMAFTSNGDLFVGGASSIYLMDVVTCETSVLVKNSYYETSGDLVGLPDGYLYWTVRGDSNDELVRVDPETGSTAWVGTIAERSLFGLGYANEQLFGFSAKGTVVRISPVGAASSIMVDNVEMSWWGATTNPVTW